MNKYLLSFIEVVLFAIVAFFLGKNIFLFTDDDSLVNLNYIFWALIAILSVLSNFGQYIYFGTVFVLGIIFLGIYIFKVVKVITFVERDYKPIFWMLFGIFFIPFFVLFTTKKILVAALNSEAPQGDKGLQGERGNLGKEYFIESISDKAYVTIINEIEELFIDILNQNEIDYDYNERQFNNFYLKENIKRICYSKQFIDQIINKNSNTAQYDICLYSKADDKRYCSNKDKTFSDPKIECNQNEDCYSVYSIENYEEMNNKLSIQDQTTPLYEILIRIKYWIRLILENNCEDDRKLRDKLNVAEYYNLNNLRMGFITNFQEYQENQAFGSNVKKDNYFKLNKVNYKRMNNLLGRKFLQDNFQNHNYWKNNNIKKINRNPFTIIHADPIWQYGLPQPDIDDCANNSNPIIPTCRDYLEHPNSK